MMTFNTGWHVLYVKSRFEKKVHESLLEISLDSFLPLVKTLRKWSDRKKVIDKPLFPSYVFVNIHSSLDFYRALSVNGASAYIRFGNNYAVVRDAEMDRIKFLVGLKDVKDIEVNSQNIGVGDCMKIASGPLSGIECEVLHVNNLNKIIVRLDSLQKSIIATVPLYYLQDTIITS